MLPWSVSVNLHIIEGFVCFIVCRPPPPSLPNIKYSLCPVGHNFCAEAPKCGENSECKNWNTKATCECKSGYISVQGNSAYCEGKGQRGPRGARGREVWFQLHRKYGISYARTPVPMLAAGRSTWETKRYVRSKVPSVSTPTPGQPEADFLFNYWEGVSSPKPRDVASEFPLQMTVTAWLRPSSYLSFPRAECFSSWVS